jgi:hypothetical protein
MRKRCWTRTLRRILRRMGSGSFSILG